MSKKSKTKTVYRYGVAMDTSIGMVWFIVDLDRQVDKDGMFIDDTEPNWYETYHDAASGDLERAARAQFHKLCPSCEHYETMCEGWRLQKILEVPVSHPTVDTRVTASDMFALHPTEDSIAEMMATVLKDYLGVDKDSISKTESYMALDNDIGSITTFCYKGKEFDMEVWNHQILITEIVDTKRGASIYLDQPRLDYLKPEIEKFFINPVVPGFTVEKRWGDQYDGFNWEGNYKGIPVTIKCQDGKFSFTATGGQGETLSGGGFTQEELAENLVNCIAPTEATGEEPVNSKKYYRKVFNKAHDKWAQMDIDDGGDGSAWEDYMPETPAGVLNQDIVDAIVGYYLVYHEPTKDDPSAPYHDWLENTKYNKKPTANEKEVTRILKALFEPECRFCSGKDVAFGSNQFTFCRPGNGTEVNMGKDGSLVETFDWKFCPECGRKL